MSLLPTQRDWVRAFRDLRDGIAARRIWMLLGVNDIRVRYNRSKFGQFWITLSMGVFIAGIGVVYGTLFNQPMHDYLPYLAVNVCVWTMISSTISEASSVFTQATMYLRQDSIAKSVFVIRLIVRNLIVLAHNVSIIPLAFLAFSYPVTGAIVLAIPGLVIVILALLLMSMCLGVLATRFRDLPQIIQNVMQLLFFVTPVMWRADQMSPNQQQYILLNPFAALLRIVTEPILGRVPPAETYGSAVGFIALLLLVTLPIFARFRPRIVYWL